MDKLRKTQQAVYNFIKSFIEERDFPPTVREICAAVGLKSTSTVHAHLKNLERLGYINLNPSLQRSITLVDSPRVSGVKVPLIGDVAAGQPILAVENIQDEYLFSPSLLHGATNPNEVIMLSVKGDSMIDIGMNNGDKIIAHTGLGYSDGDVVVARVHGDETTVKRIYKEKQRVRLQPENSRMAPIYVDYADIEVIGKVIGLFRSY